MAGWHALLAGSEMSRCLAAETGNAYDLAYPTGHRNTPKIRMSPKWALPKAKR